MAASSFVQVSTNSPVNLSHSSSTLPFLSYHVCLIAFPLSVGPEFSLETSGSCRIESVEEDAGLISGELLQQELLFVVNCTRRVEFDIKERTANELRFLGFGQIERRALGIREILDYYILSKKKMAATNSLGENKRASSLSRLKP